MKRSIFAKNRKKQVAENKSKLLENIETAANLKLHPLIHRQNNLVEVSNLSIFYGEKKICKNINFTAGNGDRIALWGKMG